MKTNNLLLETIAKNKGLFVLYETRIYQQATEFVCSFNSSYVFILIASYKDCSLNHTIGCNIYCQFKLAVSILAATNYCIKLH